MFLADCKGRAFTTLCQELPKGQNKAHKKAKRSFALPTPTGVTASGEPR